MRNLLSTTALIAPFLVSAALAQEAPATDQNDQTDPQAEELVEDLPDTEPENDDEDDEADTDLDDETDLETEVEATETGIETDPDLDTDAEVEMENDLDIETETDPATEDTFEAEPLDEPVEETDPAAPAADPDTAPEAEAPMDEAPVDEAIVREQAQNELRVDWITGSRVNSYDGENIGRITDLIFDEESHQITVAILSVGGFLGIGAKDIAVKFEELTIDYDAREIQLNLTRDAADAAPEYVFRQRAERPVEEPVADPMDDPAPAAPMD